MQPSKRVESTDLVHEAQCRFSGTLSAIYSDKNASSKSGIKQLINNPPSPYVAEVHADVL
jgi:hypothetical protein